MENVRIIKKKIPADLLQYFQVKKQNRWILRNSIIWWKRNCMPSSASDRFTVDYETIAFFTKQGKYWFEQQFEPHLSKEPKPEYKRPADSKSRSATLQPRSETAFVGPYNPQGRNMRCVWDITTQPFKEAHFAVFPPELPSRCIKAGCPKEVCPKCGKAREKITESVLKDGKFKPRENEKYSAGSEYLSNKTRLRSEIERIDGGYTDCGCNAGFEPGVVLDIFMGSGTTAVVAKKLGRQWLGIELSEKYIEMANKRIAETAIQAELSL